VPPKVPKIPLAPVYSSFPKKKEEKADIDLSTFEAEFAKKIETNRIFI